jgi:hypothetical protein
MQLSELITSIDSEISRLKQVRSLLNGLESRSGVKAANRQSHRGGKRTLSAAARARISAAQKKRWAQQKRAAKR